MDDDNKSSEAVPDILDRRGANRAASAWVRNALNDQSAKIDKIADDVQHIAGQLDKAIPDKEFGKHWQQHQLFDEREKERQRIEARKQAQDEDREKFWSSIKADIISYALKGAGLFIVGVFVLGFQAKFKEWVLDAVSFQPTQTEVKK
jgi:hypothetical protein